MKLLDIRIRDFLGIDEAALQLDGQGVVLIEGENRDDPSALSNGAGKSSLIDAIPWVLFGASPRGGAADSVIRRGAKSAWVCLRFAVGEEIYTVTRERGPRAKLSLSLDVMTGGDPATRRDLTQGTADLTQQVIARVIGCTEEVLFAAVICAQDNMPNLPAMTDRQLKAIVEEAAGLSVLARAYELARERERSALAKAAAAHAALERKQAHLEEAAAALEGARRNAEDWENRRCEDVERLAFEVGNEQASVDVEQKSLDDSEPTFERLRLGHAALREKIANVVAIEGERRDLAARRDAALMARDARLSELHAAEEALKVVEGEMGLLMEGKADTCDACGSVYTPEHRRHALGVLDARERKARDAVGAAHGALEAAQGALEAACAAWEGAPLPPDAGALMAQEKRVVDVIAMRDRRIADHRLAQARLASKKKALDDLTAAPNPFERLIFDVSKRHDATKKLIADELAPAVAATESEARRAASAAQVFSNGGVRAQILDEVTPLLNDRTSLYLSALTDGSITATWSTLSRTAKGELRERFAIEVTAASGATGFDALSGGEKRKVRLACTLALQDLVATRAERPINLWVGDEIDDALDAAGLERLMGLLALKAEERGTVLVVSHNDLKHWIPNTIRVVREGGSARVMA